MAAVIPMPIIKTSVDKPDGLGDSQRGSYGA
jgi:hypothetical protein